MYDEYNYKLPRRFMYFQPKNLKEILKNVYVRLYNIVYIQLEFKKYVFNVRLKHDLLKTCAADHIQKCSTFITEFLRMHYSTEAQWLKIGLEKLSQNLHN